MRKITHPVFISVQQEATGKRMRQLFQQNGYSVRDVQTAMGFENPQAIYKWLAGRSLPSIDNLIVLSVILHVSIEEILVVDGDFCLCIKKNRKKKRSMKLSEILVVHTPFFSSIFSQRTICLA